MIHQVIWKSSCTSLSLSFRKENLSSSVHINKKKIAGAINVLINELGKYVKKKSNKYADVEN